jgi:Niemann-Pick C1 protein
MTMGYIYEFGDRTEESMFEYEL